MRLAVVAALLLSSWALAAELNGVTAADKVTVEGKDLALNGQGLRRKFIFDVYVASLYVEHPVADGAALLARDEVRRCDMTMLRDLDQKSIVEALRQGFEKNAGDKLPGLKASLDQFAALVPDVKKGQTLVITYVPGKGTTVQGQGAGFTAQGKDFADALFSVWIGKYPVDERLKRGMLGGK